MTAKSKLAYLKRRQAFDAAIDALESLFRSNDFMLLNTFESKGEALSVSSALETIKTERRAFILANQEGGLDP
jgi:hypothetical protein